MRMLDQGEQDDKIISVHADDPEYAVRDWLGWGWGGLGWWAGGLGWFGVAQGGLFRMRALQRCFWGVQGGPERALQRWFWV